MRSSGQAGLLLGLALAASACAMTPALAQSISAQTTKIIELERAGKFSWALTLAQKTLADAEKTHGPVHRDVAAALNNLGHAYANLGQDSEAEPLYKRALAIFEKVGGLDSADVARSLNNMADLYERQNRLAEAEPLYRRAIFCRLRRQQAGGAACRRQRTLVPLCAVQHDALVIKTRPFAA